MMKRLLLFITSLIVILAISCGDDKSPTGNGADKLPLADCGPDRTVIAGELAFVDASASKPVKTGITNYIWERDENNPVIVQYRTGDNPAQFYFGFREPGTYKLYLTVDEGAERSKPDTLTVTVLPRNNIVFEDARLEIAVRYAIKYCNGDFTDEILAGVDSLSAFSPITPYKITSLKGIEKCPNLKYIDMTYQELVKDLTPLSSLNSLEYLYFYNNPNLSDLSPLKNIKGLKYLTLYSCPSVTSVEPLSELTNLVYLNFIESQNISDYKYLSEMINLEELYISRMPNIMKGNISFISKMIKLKKLTLTNSLVSDITAVENLENLEEINLSKNSFIKIDSLKKCLKIKFLYMNNNGIEDITPLSNLSEIQKAYLHSNRFKNIKPLFDNPGIAENDSLSFTVNKLDSLSLNIYMPALKARGVIIEEH